MKRKLHAITRTFSAKSLLRPAMLSLMALGMAWNASAQAVPELMYFRFDTPGPTIVNEAAPATRVSASGSLTTNTIGSTGQFGTALLGNSTTGTSFDANWVTNLTGAWTVSMWFSGVTNTLSSNYPFGAAGGTTFRALTGSGVVAGAGNLEVRSTGMTDMFANGCFDATGTPVVVTFVYDPATLSGKSYINGVLQGTYTQPAALSVTGTNFTIGNYGTSVGLNTGGKMDEFRLYNRALSQAEITATWNQPLPAVCSGTPSAATAAGPASAVCAGASFNLTSTGHSVSPNITYRWQSRVGTSGPFTYITGATTIPYAASAMANSQYRLVTTCPTSNLSDTSNIVTVNVNPRPHVDSISETHNAVGVYNFLSHGATNVTSYSWNFGDATPLGNGAAPVHTYVVSGSYTVRLITSNSCGNDTVYKAVNVVVPPQCVTASGPLSLTTPSPTVCANTQFVITARNAAKGPALWHIWQSSPAGTNNWTTRAVNKDTTFATFISATTDFRIKDSCAIPNGVATSGILQVALPPAPQITAIARTNVGLTYNYSATNVANVTTYEWDFGDGTPKSALPSPTHTYAVNSTYMVTVIVSNGCTAEMRIIKFSTINVGVGTLNTDDAFRIYPNPANQFLTINATDQQQIAGLSVINSMGVVVKSAQNINTKDYQLDTRNFPSGNYFLRINTASGIINKSFQVVR